MSPDLDLDYAVVDGLRIAYRSAGAGPAIALLHGNPTFAHFLPEDSSARIGEALLRWLETLER